MYKIFFYHTLWTDKTWKELNNYNKKSIIVEMFWLFSEVIIRKKQGNLLMRVVMNLMGKKISLWDKHKVLVLIAYVSKHSLYMYRVATGKNFPGRKSQGITFSVNEILQIYP